MREGIDYHSALKAPLVVVPCERVYFDRSTAFVYDITKGVLHPEYSKCDILYTDPAWKDGLTEFDKRADKKEIGNFNVYFESVRSITRDSKVPVILVCGKFYKDNLPYTRCYETTLNGYPCFALVFGEVKGISNTKTSFDIVECLAKNYKFIGDFCCGYGNTGRIFKKHKKNFIMSDYNPMCIGYIANNYYKWR